MLFRAVARVVVLLFLSHVFVGVICFDLKHEAVGECVQELPLVAELLLQRVVKEVAHTQLAVV